MLIYCCLEWSHHLRSLGVPPVSLHEGAGTPMFKTQISVVDKQLARMDPITSEAWACRL